MILVIVGMVLLVLKFAGFGPVADWPWWALGMPFAGAVVWWMFADAFGLTQRFAISRFEARRAHRRRRTMEMLGLAVRGSPPATAPSSSMFPAGAGPGIGPTRAAPAPAVAPRPSTTARNGPDFGDTVPSMLDVPEDLAAPRSDLRKMG